MWIMWLVLIVGGYLLGSIPSAYVLVKAKNGIDIRRFGSGNPGTTNTMRAAGPVTGILVFLCDSLKGAIPTLIALHTVGPLLACCAAMAAFIGHLFPVWLNFKGGKGTATAMGIAIVLVPWLALISLGFWAAMVLILRYVSIGSCAAALLIALLVLATLQPWYMILLFGLIALAIILRHRSNFEHIRDGTENKIFSGKYKNQGKIQ